MNSAQISLEQYINALRRRFPLFAKVSLPVFALGLAIALALPDVYRSAAEFRIDLEGPNLEGLEPIFLTHYADQYIAGLRQKVASRDNLEVWVEEFDLYPAQDDATPGQLVGLAYENIHVSMVTTPVTVPGAARRVDLITGFRVGFNSADPVKAQLMAERLAAEFVKEDHHTRTQEAATASAFLREQIDATREEVLQLEAKLADFKEANAGMLPEMMAANLVSVDRLERELDSVRADIRSLEQDRIFRQAQLDQLVQASASSRQLAELEQEYLRMVGTYGADHPDLIRIKRQIAALTSDSSEPETGEVAEIDRLQRELDAARERYSDEHPDIVRLTRQIDRLRNENGSAIESMRSESREDPLYLQLRAQINAIDSRIQALTVRAQETQTRLRQTQGRLDKAPQIERDYQELTRDLDTARATYRKLQDRLATAQETEALESGERGARVTQVQRAYVPEVPASPARLPIALVGLFLAITLGGMAAIAAEVLDTTVRGSRDVDSLLSTPPIGAIPIVQNSLSRAEARRRRMIYTSGVLLLASAVAAVATLPPFGG